ncbi:hypothetical protein ACFY4C_20455 [Actinomadura viridis]|uniref:hypothetical protein n=1 Tax=Actinomadura viridis TaxID=58110 RepID=UPI003694BE78
MSSCIGYDAISDTPCPREAEETFLAGCIHEHIGSRELCQYHIADLAEGRMVCGDCHKCSDPHHCVLEVIPVRSRA